MGRVSEKGSPVSCAPASELQGPGREILFLFLGMTGGGGGGRKREAVLVEPWPLLVPSYLWADVLLDTSGETSEIGWLTYPPGGVSVTCILNLRPHPHPSPWRVKLGKETLGRTNRVIFFPPEEQGFGPSFTLLCMLLIF